MKIFHDKLNQKKYWNSVAAKKRFTTPVRTKLIEKILPYDALITDVGCGYGRTMQELYISGFNNINGFDFSEEMISKGKKLYPKLNLKIMKNGYINIKDFSVDMVLLFAVLTCVTDEVERINLINEVDRIVKPGGYVYINDFLINSDERNKKRYLKFESKYNTYGVFELPDGAVLQHFYLSDLLHLWKGYSLKFKETETFATMNGNVSNGITMIFQKTCV